MTTYGLTPTGFVPKTLDGIKAEYEGDFTSIIGAGVNLEPESVDGQLIGIWSERDAEMWEALTDLSAAIDPDQATGSAQDVILGITGTTRHGAKFSKSVALAVGTPGSVLDVDRVFSVLGSGVRFATTEAVTIAAVPAWMTATGYAVGDVITSGGNAYYATTPGISASAPAGAGTAIADGSVVWRFVGAGTGAITVPVEAEETGPKPANAWSLSVVETAVAGLNAVTNPLDAIPGADVELDAFARPRRELELQSSGNSAVNAIRGKLLKVKDVTSAYVFENNDPINTNGDGMPPNSVEAVVDGGDDEVVRLAVFNAKGGGIQAVGTNTGTIVDTEGNSHTVAFSRPDVVTGYLDILVDTDSEAFPVDGIDEIKDELSDWGLVHLGVGDDLNQSQLFGPIFNVPGVKKVTQLRLGTSAWPGGTGDITTTSRQEVKLDTSRIRVNGL